jgi:hypothetical protein
MDVDGLRSASVCSSLLDLLSIAGFSYIAIERAQPLGSIRNRNAPPQTNAARAAGQRALRGTRTRYNTQAL